MNPNRFLALLKARIESDPELTEAGLATMAGLDKSTIRRMFRENRNPRIDTAIKICSALGETLEGFLSQDRDPVTAEILFHLEQLTDEERRLLLGATRGLRAQHPDQGQ